MILRNIDFGNVIGASGVEGFFGRYLGYSEYFHHAIFKKIVPGFTFEGMTFVAKTTTLEERAGNLKLKKDKISVASILPDCIIPYFFGSMVLNAVSLSGPGAEFLFDKKIWQGIRDPFMISFMSVGDTMEERKAELHAFVEMFLHYLPGFRRRPALQINLSCPNTKHGQEELVSEIMLYLSIASKLDIPLIVKFNLLASHQLVFRVSRHPACDAICITNSLPFGSLPELINWKKYFGSSDKKESPLAKYGGGGLSGEIAFPILCDWLEDAKEYQFPKPFLAGGGIYHKRDVITLSKIPNVKAISPGSVSIVRPWRLRSIINTANSLHFNA